ncbi:helix-turn-helix domain-containing protein [Spirosoma endophyticum]|uniref:Uncharacterized protein n=1 Tax=Spirosoma endophyticum TaxID=662367 RepID=A0A1I2BJL2_9BACT|nr:helix-turn-helix transcriptional regulator [Spirosoma endophyticum]SFE55410.1 hypothetical protein SAMN05216167_11599 [Spirosoma endophyticum]
MKKKKDSEVVKWKSQFAKRFELIREASGMSQVEMADTIGMSQNLVYRSEKDCDISLNSFLLLFVHYMKNYKMNPEWFFAEDNSGFTPYEMESKKTKRVSSAVERRRNKIILDMFNMLQRDGLMPQAETNTTQE